MSASFSHTVCALLAGAPKEGTERRQLRPPAAAVALEPAIAPDSRDFYTSKADLIVAQAEALGYCCTPVAQWELELANSVSTRMPQRVGEDTYQSMAFSLAGFPCQAARSLFPEEPSSQKHSVTLWTVPALLQGLVGILLSKSRANVKPGQGCSALALHPLVAREWGVSPAPSGRVRVRVRVRVSVQLG